MVIGESAIAVVGVDGSPNSLAALAFAADVVGGDGTIHVVTIGETADRRSELEQAWLQPYGDSGTSTRLHLADSDPAEVVTEFGEATRADLIVLGTHSGPAHVPRAVGSVVHKVLHRSPCPVAVVRDRGADSAVTGPVIVGIGASSAIEPATSWAGALAQSRSLSVELVRVVNMHPLLGVNDAIEVLASYIDRDQLMTWAEEELDVVAQNFADTGLVVGRHVTSGDVGSVLVSRSEGAAALVVGKRFDGKLTGYFTGRTVHHVLTHASCPVVVVPGAAD